MADRSFFSDKKNKEWFANFFYYYKYRMILIAVFLLLIVFGMVQCSNSVTYDLTVTYYGSVPLDDVKMQSLTDEFSGYINGKQVRVAQLTEPQQLLLEVGAGESYLYILDEDVFATFAGENQFEDISGITGGESPEYGIPFRIEGGNKPMLIGVRILIKDRAELETEVAKHDNAMKVLRELFYLNDTF